MINVQTKGEKVFNVALNIFMFFIVVIMLYPFLNQIALSLSSNDAVMLGKVTVFPIGLDFSAYREVMADSRFVMSFMNTVMFTVCGTAMHMIVITMFAYSLSVKKLKGIGIINKLLIFSMVFGTGGLIPTYMNMRNFHLINSFWALWLLSMVNIYQIMILKKFFQQIPESINESAQIDGARPILIFFKIIVPLSLPSIAAISLFSAVNYWNTFFIALVYLTSSDKRLLQVHLNEILQNFTQSASASDGTSNVNMLARETVKAATLLCTTVPIICVYPFLQRYFVKGVMVGAIKG